MRGKYAILSVIFLILYAFVHLGFYPTYFRHFPNFEPFKLMHHIHGGIMSGWLFLLIAQPLFLAIKKPEWHVVTGRLSYVYAPIVILSLFQVTKFSYNRWVDEVGHAQAISDQALSLGQIATFGTFYALAMLFRRKLFLHVRFICATGLLALLPAANRLMRAYTELDPSQCLFISSMLTICTAFLFLVYDILKRKNPVPCIVISVWYILFFLFVEARETELYQTLGSFIAKHLV